MKVLIITPYIYMSNSLQETIRFSENLDIDLIIGKTIIKKFDQIEYVRRRLNGKVNNIYEYILPFDNCYVGKSSKIRYKIPLMIKNILSIYYLPKIRKLIETNKYDIIYLNNLIIHGLISKNANYVIHIREKYDQSRNKKVFKSLLLAKGVIFIDETTLEPFSNLEFKNFLVLNNPFHMKPSLSKLKMNVDFTKKTVFSLIGRLEEVKGTKFILEAFSELQDNNFVLLIVGSGERDYVNQCKKIVENDDRVVFCPGDDDIQKYYDVSDYVLRGEKYQCIGRTIYEGLYSGCNVIVPGSPNNSSMYYEYEKYKENIFFYKPYDKKDLIDVVNLVKGNKVHNRKYYSNIDLYISRYENFLMVSSELNKIE